MLLGWTRVPLQNQIPQTLFPSPLISLSQPGATDHLSHDYLGGCSFDRHLFSWPHPELPPSHLQAGRWPAFLGCSVILTPWSVPSGSSVHGILQARILEWLAISSSRGIFPTQESKPCLLHWQEDSLLIPLR